jgi:hypothetical protein
MSYKSSNSKTDENRPPLLPGFVTPTGESLTLQGDGWVFKAASGQRVFDNTTRSGTADGAEMSQRGFKDSWYIETHMPNQAVFRITQTPEQGYDMFMGLQHHRDLHINDKSSVVLPSGDTLSRKGHNVFVTDSNGRKIGSMHPFDQSSLQLNEDWLLHFESNPNRGLPRWEVISSKHNGFNQHRRLATISAYGKIDCTDGFTLTLPPRLTPPSFYPIVEDIRVK